jgi:hypothetical protein
VHPTPRSRSRSRWRSRLKATDDRDDADRWRPLDATAFDSFALEGAGLLGGICDDISMARWSALRTMVGS